MIKHGIHLKRALRIIERFIHVLSQLVIEQGHGIASEVRSQFDVDALARLLAAPLWMVVFLVAVHVNYLHESGGLFEAVELEGLGKSNEGISLNMLLPAFIATTVLDSVNLIRIHLDQLRFAKFVESRMLLLDLRQILVVEREAGGELGWQVLLALDWHEQAAVSGELLHSSQVE